MALIYNWYNLMYMWFEPRLRSYKGITWKYCIYCRSCSPSLIFFFGHEMLWYVCCIFPLHQAMVGVTKILPVQVGNWALILSCLLIIFFTFFSYFCYDKNSYIFNYPTPILRDVWVILCCNALDRKAMLWAGSSLAVPRN